MALSNEILGLVSDIHDTPTLSLSVLDHDLGAPFQEAIAGVSPWHLLVGLNVLSKGLSKWKDFTCFFCVVVLGLNVIEL